MHNHEGPGENGVEEQLRQLATAVREACFAAALTAYQDARTDGLCHDGAWECAVDAMRAVRIETLAGT